MKKLLLSALILACFSNFVQAQSSENLVKYVKPNIGTQRMGHTFPGATVPFGSVQLSQRKLKRVKKVARRCHHYTRQCLLPCRSRL